jgi:hypothetical protein
MRDTEALSLVNLKKFLTKRGLRNIADALAKCDISFRADGAKHLKPKRVLGYRFLVDNDLLQAFEKEGCWPKRKTPEGKKDEEMLKAKCIKYQKVLDKYMREHMQMKAGLSVPPGGKGEAYHIEGISVSHEEDLRRYLVRYPDLLEPGLKLIEEHYRIKAKGAGIIDILCQDKKGKYVVVETKRNRPADKVVVQVMRYIQGLKEEKREARGIIVLHKKVKKMDFSLKQTKASINIKYYRILFEFADEPWE